MPRSKVKKILSKVQTLYNRADEIEQDLARAQDEIGDKEYRRLQKLIGKARDNYVAMGTILSTQLKGGYGTMSPETRTIKRLNYSIRNKVKAGYSMETPPGFIKEDIDSICVDIFDSLNITFKDSRNQVFKLSELNLRETEEVSDFVNGLRLDRKIEELQEKKKELRI